MNLACTESHLRNVLCAATLAVCLLPGCGGASGSASTTPWADEDTALFQNAIDHYEPFDGGGGQWGDTWRNALTARVGRADRVAVIAVRAIHTGVDLDGNSTFRIAAEVQELLAGADGGGEFTLEAREGGPGFRAVQRSENRLLTGPYVAFLRFQELPDGPELHWHLSHATPFVRSQVEEALGHRHETDASRRTVVVH